MILTKTQLRLLLREQVKKTKAASIRKKLAFMTNSSLKFSEIAGAFPTKQITLGKMSFDVLDTSGLWAASPDAVEKNIVDAINALPGIDAYWKKDIPGDPVRQAIANELPYNPDVLYFDKQNNMFVVEVKKTKSSDFGSLPTASNVGYNWYILIAEDVGYLLSGKKFAVTASSREDVKKIPKGSQIKEFEIEKLRELPSKQMEFELDQIAQRVSVTAEAEGQDLKSFIKAILKNRIAGDKSAKLTLPMAIAGHKIRADIKFEGKEVKTKRNYLRSIIEEQYTLAVIHKFVRESFELIPEQIQPGVIQVTLRRTAPTVSDPQQQKQLAQLIAKILDKEGSGESTQAEYAQAESAGVTFEQLKDLVGQYGKSSYVSKAQAYSPETYKKASLKKSFQKTWRGV